MHPHILQHVREYLQLREPTVRALDIGCGAGRSTAALAPHARRTVGIDPVAAMLKHRRSVAPSAQFVVGEAERLPFLSATFDLITAAGSLNYADLSLALPEIARLLVSSGTLVIYDFSAGRRLAAGGALDDWYTDFEQRYPDAPGYEMDVRRLPYDRAGLAFRGYEEFQIAIPMTRDSYVRYVTSETRIDVALGAGAKEAEIHNWCRQTLHAVFGDEPRDVVFDGYAAYVTRSND